MSKKLFSFDAETNGLHGQAFALSAVVYEDGKKTSEFIARCPIDGDINPWVAENVIPQMTFVSETHKTYSEMLKAFAEYYMNNKDGATIIVHMGLPVEAKVMLDMHNFGFIGDWDMPYPLIDVSATLEAKGFDPTSVDAYNAEHSIQVTCEGGTHNPLYDSIAAAQCYMHLLG